MIAELRPVAARYLPDVFDGQMLSFFADDQMIEGVASFSLGVPHGGEATFILTRPAQRERTMLEVFPDQDVRFRLHILAQTPDGERVGGWEADGCEVIHYGMALDEPTATLLETVTCRFACIVTRR